MVLEASRQHEQALNNARGTTETALEACEHCGDPGHPSNLCYTMYPHLAPEWFELKMKSQAKEKGLRGDRPRTKLATYEDGEDDFQDREDYFYDGEDDSQNEENYFQDGEDYFPDK